MAIDPIEVVTADEVRAQLRLDEPEDGGDDPHATWIEMWIVIVSASIASWLKDEWRLYVPLRDSNFDVVRDSNDDPVPSDVFSPLVRGAALLEIASQFRFREGEGTNVVPADAGHGYVLSKGATAMLAGLRKSTVG